MVLAGVRSAHIPSAVPKREANRAREALGTLGVDVRAPLRGKKASEGSAAPGVDLVVLGSWDLKGARSKLKGQKGFLVVGSSFLEEWASRGEVWAGSTIRGARNRGCGALLNQTLGKLEIVLAGFKDEEREELKFLAEALGAAVSDEFKARTNVVVSSRLDSPEGQLALAARIKEDQDVVVVGRKWLDQCVEKRTLASAWDNRLCCLADMEARPSATPPTGSKHSAKLIAGRPASLQSKAPGTSMCCFLRPRAFQCRGVDPCASSR
jgi:hypothetical protein